MNEPFITDEQLAEINEKFNAIFDIEDPLIFDESTNTYSSYIYLIGQSPDGETWISFNDETPTRILLNIVNIFWQELLDIIAVKDLQITACFYPIYKRDKFAGLVFDDKYDKVIKVKK